MAEVFIIISGQNYRNRYNILGIYNSHFEFENMYFGFIGLSTANRFRRIFNFIKKIETEVRKK